MRLEGVVKAGYYPTPQESLQRIANMLQPARQYMRLLDPCAGEGEALAYVSNALSRAGAQTETFAVELSYDRHERLAPRVDTAILSAWNDVTTRNRSMSLLYLNPPYDWEIEREEGQRRKRLEYEFLQKTWDKLAIGGVLVYIVPLNGIDQRSFNFLATRFDELSVYRLPDGEFEIFKQLVIFGRRTQGREDVSIPWNYSLDNLPPELPAEPERTYHVPPSPKIKDFYFRKWALEPSEVVEVVQKAGVYVGKQWKMARAIPDEAEFRPLTPLKRGHVAWMVTSGIMGTTALGDIVAKGQPIKRKDDRTPTVLDEDGNEKKSDTQIIVEVPEAPVTIINRQGQVEVIKAPHQLGDFIEQHAEPMAKIMEERYDPLYQGPSEEEWRTLSRLMKGKKVAGRKKTGLFTAQKHTAVAALRALHAYGWVTIVGEMGTGKTTTSIATLEILGQWPAVVMCPTHLVEKWAAEVSHTIPGAKGFVIATLADLIRFVRDYKPGEKWVAVVSKENAKLGPGWKHQYVTKPFRLRLGQIGNEFTLRVNGVACPKCGALQRDKDDDYILAEDNDHVDARLIAHLPRVGKRRLSCKGKHVVTHVTGGYETVEERECGEPLWQTEGYRRWPIADYIHDHLPPKFFRVLIADEAHEYKAKDTAQAQAYHALRDSVEYTINLTGTYFSGKSTSLFYLLYRNMTEVRNDFEFNGEKAWAEKYGVNKEIIKEYESEEEVDGYYSTKGKSRKTVQELPGILPTIVSRLLPNTIFLRITDLGWKLPPYSEEVVRIQMAPEQARQYNWLHEKLLGNIREGMSSYDSESKAKAQRLLSVWLQSTLGRPNSGFRHEVVTWKWRKGDNYAATHAPYGISSFDTLDAKGEPLGRDVSEIEMDWEEDPDLEIPYDLDEMYEQMRNSEQDGEPMLLERIVEKNNLLPKEEWLLQKVQEEWRAGNKTIVFCRQTGTKDIQQRLARILNSITGLRVQILPKNVSAKRRDKWIADRADQIDVLICNPEMVKTGLDLVQFNRMIWFEITYSLFTLWQAMKRIYRIGQVRDSKIYFVVYQGTMEEAALGLLGQKLRAANLLYGDSAESAVADEGDSDNILEELAKKVMSGDTFANTKHEQFMQTEVDAAWEEEDEEEIEEEPDQTAPAVVDLQPSHAANPPRRKEPRTYHQVAQSWSDWLKAQGYDKLPVGKKRKKKEEEREPEAHQATLFDLPTEMQGSLF